MTPVLIIVVALLGIAAALLWRRREPALRLRVRDLAAAKPRERDVPWYASRGRPGMALLALIGLIALWLVVTNLGLVDPGVQAPAGKFVVRVAPLLSTGADQRHGAIVAQQLLDELKGRITTPMNLGLLPARVSSAEEALAAARSSGADVVIWGQVLEGTTAAQPGLRPYLLWLPDEPFVPRTWQGFDGHFALAADYDLAREPLNGAAILPPLIDSLNHFSQGDVDRAEPLLETLREDYGDVLRPELPATLQMLSLWAQGLLPAAESAARDAVQAGARAELWNNLGAVLLDQQQLDAARTALTEALAAAPDLPQAHANLGRLLLDEGRPADALPDLRAAANQLPTSPAIVASLGEAYRRSGELAAARAAMTRVLNLDPGNGPALSEQSMLALTPVLTATGRLEWELEPPPTRTREELAEIRRSAEAGIAEIEALRNEFLRRANAYGVAGRPAMQRLAETQAALLEQEILNRRYQLMLVQIEQGRLVAAQPRSGFRRVWDALRGARTPLNEAIATATAALRQEPSLALQYDFHYQAGRAAALSGNPNTARTQYEAAQSLADNAPEGSPLKGRPEAHYGRALLLLDTGHRDEARAALQAALDADEAFWPAQAELAALAEADERWTDAVVHRRWLAAQRPWISQTQIDLARVLRAQGEVAAAEAELLPLANAGNAEALVTLAAIYRTSGQLAEADRVIERALTIAPEQAGVHEEVAEIALARDDAGHAELALLRAVELDPQRGSARIRLARFYADRGQPAAAAEQFRAVVGNTSRDPLVHRQLGEALLQIGNAEAAEESFKRALELAPNSHEAHHGLAMAYLAQNQFGAATKSEQRALDLAGGNYTLALVGMGDILREQGQYAAAIERYQAALERDPLLATAFLGLGQAAAAQGQTAIAIDHFRAGLVNSPQNVPLLLGLGDALLQHNDTGGARSAYEQAKELAPDNASASAGIGRALWKDGQIDAALAELAQAVQLNPRDATTLLTIGDIHASRDDNQSALAAYAQAIEARDTWYEPRFRRGVLLLKLQQNEAATEDLQAAVKLNPDFAQGHYWLGRARRAAGDFAAARRALERAVALQGTYYEARFFLGRTLDELGNAPEAVAVYEALLNEAPPNEPWRAEAERELDRIR